jgi:hypothetical protein
VTAESTRTAPRSRRALLAGAIGGLGVWAASAIGRAAPADAAAGDPIRMGRLNKASGTSTELQTSTSRPAFRATQLGGGAALRGDAGSGRAVMGIAGSSGTGVWASSPDHIAVSAQTTTGTAIHAISGQGSAIYAVAPMAASLNGTVEVHGYQDLSEIGVPGPPGLFTARLFARQNDSGKSELCVLFSTGAVQVIATEP